MNRLKLTLLFVFSFFIITLGLPKIADADCTMLNPDSSFLRTCWTTCGVYSGPAGGWCANHVCSCPAGGGDVGCTAMCPTSCSSGNCTFTGTAHCNGCGNNTDCYVDAAPAATNTPVPPPPGGSCDNGCGTCGYRDGGGNCGTDNGCCHRTCSGGSCITVYGSGSNSCNNNSDCGGPANTPTPNPIPYICGYVENSRTVPGPVAGYVMTVYDNDHPLPIADKTVQVTTDANGKFTTPAGFAQIGDVYAVRASAAPPAGYVGPAKSTTTSFSWQQPSGPDVPANSTAYEVQKLGTFDCSTDYGAGACRCNFKFNFVPKTCSIGATVMGSGSISGTFTGKGTVSATENVRLYFESSNGATLPAIPGGTSLSGPYDGLYYYLAGGCNAAPGSTCTGNFAISNIPSGNYFLHCDLPTSDPPTKCSGNPFCNYENPPMPGGVDCASTGWVSCSNNDNLSFSMNQPPTVTALKIKNFSNVEVLAEAPSRNHICQTNFKNDRRVIFEVTFSDPDGGSDITNGTVMWNGVAYSIDVWSLPSGNNRVGRVTVDYTGVNDSGVYGIGASVSDSSGVSSGLWSSGRSWKVWNCEVPINGTIYDSSNQPLVVCPSTGYSVPVGVGVSFTSLTYANVLGDKSMTVSGPSDYGGNNLIFGQEYIPSFNADFNGSLPTNGQLRVTDGAAVYCTAANRLDVSSLAVDPYQVNPQIKVDFTTVVNQESWFQVTAGGIGAKTSINDNVPITCFAPGCVPAISIGGIGGTNGLVAAPSITNDSGCGDQCTYGSPNDWYLNQNIIGERFNYKYFVDNYFNKLTIGVTLAGGNWSSVKSILGSNKIAYINGNLTIDENIVTAPGNFLMIVVSGTITVDPAVDLIEGIFVTNLGFTATGESGTKLVINGSLYSSGGNINLTRGYTTKSMNNTNPAVVVNYRPDFMFNVPKELTKSLSGWKEGN